MISYIRIPLWDAYIYTGFVNNNYVLIHLAYVIVSHLWWQVVESRWISNILWSEKHILVNICFSSNGIWGGGGGGVEMNYF